MHKRTLIMAGFIAVTVLQGISYPAIALADAPTATQSYSTSQPAGETQSSSGVENDATSDASHDAASSQTPMSSPKAAQSGTTAQSGTEAQPDVEAQSEEASGKSVDPGTTADPNKTTEPAQPSEPAKPENGWDQNKQPYYENGVMAVSKDVFIPNDPNNRKEGIWVRFDQSGNLVKGENYHNGGWYYFDTTTGAMVKGVKHISSNGGKWVYYDVVTGRMAHGEAYLHYDKEHTGWYYFDQYTGKMAHDFVYIRQTNKWVYYDKITGKMQYGERYINGGWYYMKPVTGALAKGRTWMASGNKWVYYDKITGRMVHGGAIIDGHHYFFDPYTGAQYSKQQIANRLASYARTYSSQHPDCPGALAANGGLICPFGPCMSFVWYVFHAAGLDVFLCDGAKTGWPHHNFDWYNSRGRVSSTPQVGDVAFWKFSDSWASNYSASHAGIVIEVNGGNVVIVDAAYGNIGVRSAYSGARYAHPYYDE